MSARIRNLRGGAIRAICSSEGAQKPDQESPQPTKRRKGVGKGKVGKEVTVIREMRDEKKR